MYAVVKTGGKQYRVAKDDVILVEKLAADVGDEIQLDDVMMVDDGKDPKIGAPLIDGAAVKAKVVDQTRGKKIIVFKKKRRHNYRRKNGHRQDLTVLRITNILASGAVRGAAPKKAAAPKKTDKPKDEAKADAPKKEAKDAKPTAAEKPAAKEAKAEAPAKKPAAKKAAADGDAKKPAAETPAATKPAAKKEDA